MSRHRRLYTITLWLALSGVLLRGLIPVGFMPGWAGSTMGGEPSWLIVCPAGELQVLLPQTHHHHHDNGGPDHSGHRIGEAHLGCPFAAAATPALPLALTALTIDAGVPAAVAQTRVSLLVSVAQRRLPPARAPPSFSVVL